VNDEEATRLLNRRADDVPDVPAPVTEVIATGRAVQRQNRRVTALGVALAATVVGGLVVQQATIGRTGPTPEVPSVAAPEPRVVGSGNALERWSSSTASDWVRTSDYVVVAHAVSEQALADQPESGGSIERSVELDIKKVVWTRSKPAQPLPSAVTVTAFGWTEDNVPLAWSGTPRIEPGHDYVIALVWSPAQCSPNDPPERTQWTPLGSHAVLPFDNARVGYGESEGRLVLGDADQASAGTLEERLLDQSLTELRDALRDAPPPNGQEPRTLPPPSTC